MSLPRNRHRQERRRRMLSVISRLGLIGGAFAATAFYSYRVGVELAGRDVAELRSEVESRDAALLAGRDAAAALQAALDESRRTAESYRLLAEQAPRSHDARELMRLVQAKLGSGLDKDQLATYIAAAQAPKKCTEPFSRHFAASVRGAKGGEPGARLADGLVLSATGTAAKIGGGWYDPAESVTFAITEPDGSRTEASGVLPLQHLTVYGNSEYRFTVTAGSRGTVQVAIHRCELLAG